jgi:hypothetical protein
VASGYDGAARVRVPARPVPVGETSSADVVALVVTGQASHGWKGAAMSTPLDVQQTLEHCMQNINGASETMAHDMHDAAMRLGAAAMMLASASNVVYKRAFQLTQVQTQPDTAEEPGAEGS